MSLHPYMVGARGAMDLGAWLVWDETARQAKVRAWHGTDVRYLCDDEWTCLRARRLDPAILDPRDVRDAPGIISSPAACRDCEGWGRQMVDGVCDACRAEAEP